MQTLSIAAARSPRWCSQGGYMTPHLRFSVINLILAVAILLTPNGGRANVVIERGVPPLGPMPARPGRLIVKYRPTVSTCAHCLLASGAPFASVTGTDSLDHLNHRLGVRSARALFFDPHRSAAPPAAAYRAAVTATKQRFPLRAGRAPRGEPPDLSNVFVVEIARTVDVYQAAALYARDPDVEYAEPDYEVHTTLTPNDPFFSSSGSWGQG